MILISNVGNRDVQYKGKPLDNGNIRQKSEELLNNYENEKENLSYPIIKPYLESFANKLKNIYLFVTNQEDERVRNSDTLHFGGLIKKWINENYGIGVNIIQYANNPTDYERIYDFFTSYFTQERNNFDKADKRIISLSGGTPQMNGALYIILSSIYARNNEFYSVFGIDGKLIPVNHEKTIVKIFVKNSCVDLLKINQYQSIIEILETFNVEKRTPLIILLNYANFRKNFDFDRAKEQLELFLNSIPSSNHNEYGAFVIDNVLSPLDLVKEVFWNVEIVFKNQNYLLLTALLFRLEEALLFEIVKYLFQDKIKENLTNKKTHQDFIRNLETEELDLWNSLQGVTFKDFPLNINSKELNRPVLFYIARLKINELKTDGNYIFQIGNILEILDKINKYCYNYLSEEQREKKYKNRTSKQCLGDLRNSSIIAHGFEPVSKDKIESLYGDKLEIILSNLKTHLANLLKLLVDDDETKKKKKITLDNIFDQINTKLLNFILEL